MKKGKFIGAHGGDDRPPEDFNETPPDATKALLRVEDFPGKIWEPACGRGAISEVLKDSGYEVYSTDIVDRGYSDMTLMQQTDFYLNVVCPVAGIESIVTNPPYRFKAPPWVNRQWLPVEAWISHIDSLREIKKFALLLKTLALAGQDRSYVFERTGLKRVYQFRERINVTRNGDPELAEASGMMDFAWFVFERGFKGNPTLHWITTLNQAKQEALFDINQNGW